MNRYLIKCESESNFVADVEIEVDDSEVDSSGIISGETEDTLMEMEENEEISWVQIGLTTSEYTGREL